MYEAGASNWERTGRDQVREEVCKRASEGTRLDERKLGSKQGKGTGKVQAREGNFRWSKLGKCTGKEQARKGTGKQQVREGTLKGKSLAAILGVSNQEMRLAESKKVRQDWEGVK